MTKAEVVQAVLAALEVKRAYREGVIDGAECIIMLRDLGYEAGVRK